MQKSPLTTQILSSKQNRTDSPPLPLPAPSLVCCFAQVMKKLLGDRGYALPADHC